ncbi:uncharacterized protein Bfra_003228 [Botrytis fragariae]|uniref:Uncharacterized protein n=1 Tax=Botrytis fragariae TaxID=1964551 RepID=A0A8H6B0G0_9HELO|nr:uncharacterized protein Bfra_003228 [Botrytis fragariae]KAF5876820.1 hypothetical protein Bfra_003228 [Botrytis fragariae]
MGAANTWYCLSCYTSQYGSVSAIRPCKKCKYMMSIWHQPGSNPALPVYVGTTGGCVERQAPVEELVQHEKVTQKLAS